jgi:glycosyltransferase involved in cell wall biosynthesis
VIPGTVRRVRDGDRLRLLFLGRLDPKKGIENLLDACAIVRQGKEVAFQLTVAGDGDKEYVRSLHRRIGDLGLADVVQLIGWVDGGAKASLLERSDLLVLPSHTENFGMVVAEALAHGVPVIASRGTPWGQLEEVGCGLWVENEPKALAEAVTRAAGMPLEEMGDRGRRWVSRELVWPTVAERMVDVYHRLVDGQSE